MGSGFESVEKVYTIYISEVASGGKTLCFLDTHSLSAVLCTPQPHTPFSAYEA